MRIIAGSLKGRKLLQPKDINTRPLKDLTKESIFNIINHSNKFKTNIKNSEILDLFSGVGSFGIECLSREAKFVTFVENYSNVLPVLKDNLNNLKLKNFNIIEEDIFNKLDFIKINKKFDIIFLDPPYRENKINYILLSIMRSQILDKNGIIIIHRHKQDKAQIPEFFKAIEEKNYGISKVMFGYIS